MKEGGREGGEGNTRAYRNEGREGRMREGAKQRRGVILEAVHLLQTVHSLSTVSVNVVEYLHNHFLQGLYDVCVWGGRRGWGEEEEGEELEGGEGGRLGY